MQNLCAIKSKNSTSSEYKNGLIIDLCHCTVLIVQVFQIMLEMNKINHCITECHVSAQHFHRSCSELSYDSLTLIVRERVLKRELKCDFLYFHVM